MSGSDDGELSDSTTETATPLTSPGPDEINTIKAEFHARLVAASLRMEAVRAGMIDLDGLKLLDTSKVQLAADDTVIEGARLMQSLRESKPWLFKASSSSSSAVAPSYRPVRQKSAMEMTDDEYAAARNALLQY